MQQIRSVVAREFAQVNELIVAQLHSDVPLVENVGHYIVDAGGKRLRPLLVLLAGAALGRCGSEHVHFAAAVEFIHTATLLHDDVVDLSQLRRGRPTANAAFGNAPSVLVGDFLYTRAFQLLVQLDRMDLLRHMATTTNTIAEGEVLQLVRAGKPELSEADYLDVITRKTAALFAAGCFGAALLAGADESRCRQLHDFGMDLGIAFQMIDDVLDYDGDPSATGKQVGDDLSEGKVTLPLIHALRNGTHAEQALLRRAITEKSSGELPAVIAAVQRCGSLDYSRERARHYHGRAQQAVSQLPAGPARSALADITDRALQRDR